MEAIPVNNDDFLDNPIISDLEEKWRIKNDVSFTKDEVLHYFYDDPFTNRWMRNRVHFASHLEGVSFYCGSVIQLGECFS